MWCVEHVMMLRQDRKTLADWGLESAHARDFFSGNARRLRKLVDMTRRYYGGD